MCSFSYNLHTKYPWDHDYLGKRQQLAENMDASYAKRKQIPKSSKEDKQETWRMKINKYTTPATQEKTVNPTKNAMQIQNRIISLNSPVSTANWTKKFHKRQTLQNILRWESEDWLLQKATERGKNWKIKEIRSLTVFTLQWVIERTSIHKVAQSTNLTFIHWHVKTQTQKN